MTKRLLVSAALLTLIFVALTGCGNYSPVISGVSAVPNPVEPGEITAISSNVNDPDGDDLTYDWYCVDQDTHYTAQSFNWNAPLAEGVYDFNLTVSDGRGGVAYDTLVVTVQYQGPPAVILRQPEDLGWTDVTLVWTQSQYPTWKTYQVYMSTSPGVKTYGNLVQITNFPLNRLDTSVTITNLEPGKTYYYAIAVLDSADNKTFSNEVTVTTKYFEILGSANLGGGHGQRLANTGNHIFCATLEQSVKGFNIGGNSIVSGANIPKPVISAEAYDIHISDILHVAFGTGGYHGYFIANPQNPIDTVSADPTTLTTSATAKAVAVYGEGPDVFVGCIDAANNTYTITWLEVSVSGASATVRSIDTLQGPPTDIYVDGNYVFVTEGHSGLQIWRWDQNPGTPGDELTPVSLTSINDAAQAVYVSRDLAYVAALSEGLLVFDVSNKNYPYEASHWVDTDKGNQAFGIYISGDIVYLADGKFGLRVINLDEPTKPEYLGTLEIGSEIHDVWVTKQSATTTKAILTDWFNAIYMVEWE